MTQSFTEKYRPKTLDEIKGNEEVMECLKSFTMDTLPNMLFYGPPGTGKTTAIRALLRNLPSQNILELNASDHRGIDTVRNEIKEFASAKITGIKVVILDEADSMSKEAQGALRRVIEDCRSTRFCFICNYYKKIIEPIVSRCTKFRFSPVNENSRIKEICLKEQISFDDEGVELLGHFSDGDMRKTMNDIQGIKGAYSVLNKANVLEFFGMADDEVFKNLLESLERDSFDDCKMKIEKLQIECVDLINKLGAKLSSTRNMIKMDVFVRLAEIEQRLSIGCTEKVQRNAIISAFLMNRL